MKHFQRFRPEDDEPPPVLAIAAPPDIGGSNDVDAADVFTVKDWKYSSNDSTSSSSSDSIALKVARSPPTLRRNLGTVLILWSRTRVAACSPASEAEMPPVISACLIRLMSSRFSSMSFCLEAASCCFFASAAASSCFFTSAASAVASCCFFTSAAASSCFLTSASASCCFFTSTAASSCLFTSAAASSCFFTSAAASSCFFASAAAFAHLTALLPLVMVLMNLLTM